MSNTRSIEATIAWLTSPEGTAARLKATRRTMGGSRHAAIKWHIFATVLAVAGKGNAIPCALCRYGTHYASGNASGANVAAAIGIVNTPGQGGYVPGNVILVCGACRVARDAYVKSTGEHVIPADAIDPRAFVSVWARGIEPAPANVSAPTLTDGASARRHDASRVARAASGLPF